MQRKLMYKLLTPNREKVQKIYFRNVKTITTGHRINQYLIYLSKYFNQLN